MNHKNIQHEDIQELKKEKEELVKMITKEEANLKSIQNKLKVLEENFTDRKDEIIRIKDKEINELKGKLK